MKKIFSAIYLLIVTSALFAQYSASPFVFKQADDTTNALVNWHNNNPLDGSDQQGVSTEKAYQYLSGKKSRTVIVAIIDSGIDIEHEDLSTKIWTNTGEIEGNGMDDDQNGYVDDIHGWNFIGNANGENVSNESLEMTRMYATYSHRFKDSDPSNISADDQSDYLQYLEIKANFEAELESIKQESNFINTISENFTYADAAIKTILEKDEYTRQDIEDIKSDDATVNEVKKFMLTLIDAGLDKKQIDDYKEYVDLRLNYQLNTEFDARSIIGDNPTDINDMKYGNTDMIGPDAEHGTHVAGIVGAIRNNNIGANGIAENVQIMVVRAVPNGDERDKDIALAIRYAVDNGANIINMSFGKDYSPQKSFVDEAVKYAETKGVLLIHAAGNDAKNIDVESNFPSKQYLDQSGSAGNWITVGASSMHNDKTLTADFSNYGVQNVDLFAPGVDIYATLPGNEYGPLSGTSMASPVVAGVAALVWSYYPELSVQQLKDVLMQSVVDHGKQKVNLPVEEGKAKKVKFKTLSVTGGVVNAYQAVLLAEQMVNTAN